MFSLLTRGQILRLRAGFARQGLGSVELAGLQQDRGDGLEVAVAGQGDEQVEEETLAVLEDLRTVVIHAWREERRRLVRGGGTLHSVLASCETHPKTGRAVARASA